MWGYIYTVAMSIISMKNLPKRSIVMLLEKRKS